MVDWRTDDSEVAVENRFMPSLCMQTGAPYNHKMGTLSYISLKYCTFVM